jgi:cyclase
VAAGEINKGSPKLAQSPVISFYVHSANFVRQAVQLMTTRRHILSALALAPMLAGLPLALRAQGALTSSELASGIWLVAGAGTNVVVAQGASGVVVVNGGAPAQADALLAEINRLTGGKPVTALFNTTWRPEFCGLNQLLGPQGTPIIAHENTRLWQSNTFYVDWQDHEYQPLPKAAQANQTFYKNGSLQLDDEVIEYGFISQASSDGDIYVHFTKADVLVVGNMLGSDSYVLLDYVTGGWIAGIQKTTNGLLARAGDATRVVAATGGVQGKAQLQEQADMLAHAYDRVSWAFQNGKSVEEFIESRPMQDFEARWGDSTLFLTLLYKSTWLHVPGRAVRNII